MEFFYNTSWGRTALALMNRLGVLSLGAKFVKSRYSTPLIDYYIRKYNIDMSDFKGQTYVSFADFFERTKYNIKVCKTKNALISPCDGLLSGYDISADGLFSVKGISYKLNELVPDKKLAEKFEGGVALIFRLQASDYHHFCYIDACKDTPYTLIPGELHSVQPIVLEHEPVFRVNKRYYHLLETKNFGDVLQMEVGAVLVGGVVYEKNGGKAAKGEEQGHFELCGSTIILMLEKDTKEKLELLPEIAKSVGSGFELAVKYGEKIGTLK